jgi:hypothetical protein
MGEEENEGAWPRTVLKSKRVLAAVAGGVLVALLVAYGVGRVQGCSQVQQAEGKAQEAESAKQSATTELKTQLDQTRRRVDLLEGRRHLHLALLAMDKRNFGIAQSHLQNANKLLKRGAQEGSEEAKLHGRVEQLILVATEDFAPQRQKVLDVIEAFDALVPPDKH